MSKKSGILKTGDWETIFKNLVHPIAILDADQNILAINSVLEKRLGKKAYDLQGVKCWEIFHGPDVGGPPAGCPFVQMMSSNSPGITEMAVEAFNGTYLVSCTPIFDETGRLEKVVHLATDVTAQKKAEDAIKESEIRFRTIANYTVDWESWVGPDGRLLWVNPAVEELTGYSVDECMSMKDYPLPIIAEEYRETVSRKFREALECKEGYNLEFEILHKNGTRRWGAVSWRPVYDDSGRFTGHRSSVRDITGLKDAELEIRGRDIRFTKLSSHVPGMIFQFLKRPDGTYCVPFTTEGIREIFGCSPEEVKNDFTPIARAILPEDFDNVASSIEYSSAHLTPWLCEYRIQIPGGPVRWMLGQSTPEKLADGSTIWHGFNTDVTDRKLAEERTRTLLNTLEQEKNRLSSLIDSITDEVWVSDSNGNFTIVNPAAQREFRLDSGEMISVEELAKRLLVFRPDGSPRPVGESPPFGHWRVNLSETRRRLSRRRHTGNSATVRSAARQSKTIWDASSDRFRSSGT